MKVISIIVVLALTFSAIQCKKYGHAKFTEDFSADVELAKKELRVSLKYEGPNPDGNGQDGVWVAFGLPKTDGKGYDVTACKHCHGSLKCANMESSSLTSLPQASEKRDIISEQTAVSSNNNDKILSFKVIRSINTEWLRQLCSEDKGTVEAAWWIGTGDFTAISHSGTQSIALKNGNDNKDESSGASFVLNGKKVDKSINFGSEIPKLKWGKGVKGMFRSDMWDLDD